MGATYFKNALSATRDTLDIDWDKLEEAWEIMPERIDDENHKRSLDWINSHNARRVQGTGGIATGTETILRAGQDDLDIASLQHSGVPDEQE